MSEDGKNVLGNSKPGLLWLNVMVLVKMMCLFEWQFILYNLP